MATLSDPTTLKSADKELGVAQDSIEFKLNALKETWTGVAQNLFQSDQVKLLIDGLTSLSHVIELVTEKFGLLGTVFGGLALYKGVKDITSQLKAGTNVLDMMIKIRDKFVQMPQEIQLPSANGVQIFEKVGFSLTKLGAISAAVTAIGIAAYGAYKYVHRFDDAIKELDKSSSDYNNSNSELENINSQLDETNAKIDELNSKDSLTLTEQDELAKLKSQTQELERQKTLQEAITNSNKKQMVQDAKDASEVTVKDYSDSYSWTDMGGSHTQYREKDIKAATQNEINELKGFYKKREALLNQYNKVKTKSDKQSIDNEIKLLDKSISEREKTISEKLPNMTKIAEGLFVSDKKEDVKLAQEYYDVIDSFTDINLSPLERDLKNINKFFDGSSSKNIIKENIEEAMESGVSLEDALNNIGLSIDDIGVENIDNLRQYFKDTKQTVDETIQATDKLAGSLEELTKAKDSDNQDKNWTSAVEALKNAKELYKNGKIGTDDFQTAVQFLNPKIIDPESGKYDADTYVEAWKDVKKKIGRYFDADDQIGSMQHALDDLTKKGLATKDNDEYVWTKKFKSSADAAKAFGVSVGAAETILQSLESYGFEFADVEMTSENVNTFNESLKGLKETYDSLDDDSAYKNYLNNIIKGFEGEQKVFNEDLSKLSNEQVVKIKFEYDISQIESQIAEIQNKINQSGGSVEDYASLNASKQQVIEKREEENNYKADASYKEYNSKIKELQKQLSSATNDSDKMNYQKQISAIYDLQSAFQEAFSIDKSIDWNSFLQSDKASNIFASLVQDGNLAYSDLIDIFGEDIEVKAKLKDEDISNIKKTLQDISTTRIDDIQFNVSANKEDANKVLGDISNSSNNTIVRYTAEVEGVDKATGEIQAIKDEGGKVSFFAELDDGSLQQVEAESKIDGTVMYKNIEDGASIPKDQTTSAIVNWDNNTSKVDSYKPNDKNAKVVYSADTSRLPTSLPTLYQKVVEKKVSQLGGTVRVGGSALASGTFGSSSSLSSFVEKSRNRTKHNDNALVGEEGQELVATRDGYWYTVGDRGAEFTSIPKDSVVFDAEKTKKLLKNGHINSRGSSYLGGTAYLKTQNGGRALKKSDDDDDKDSKKSKSSKSGKSKSGKSKTKSKGKSAWEKFEDNLSKLFDWIEIKLDVLSKKTERWMKYAEDAISTSGRNTNYDKAVTSLQEEINANTTAINTYLKKAKEVGNAGVKANNATKGSSKIGSTFVGGAYTNLLNGKMNITKYSEHQKSIIDSMKEWTDKALASSDAIYDLYKSMADIPNTKADQAIESLNTQLDILSSKTALIGNYDGYKNVNENLSSQIAKQNEILTAAQTAVNETSKNLDSAKTTAKGQGLSADGVNEIIINEVWSQAKKNAAMQYNAMLEAYKKADDNLKKQTNDTAKAIEELARQMFDNILKHYNDRFINRNNNVVEQIQSEQSLNQAKGYRDSENYYSAMNKYLEENDAKLNQAYTESLKQFKDDVASGKIKYGDDAYWEEVEALEQLQGEIRQNTIQMQENTNTIEEIKENEFASLIDAINEITNEADWFISELSRGTLVNNDKDYMDGQVGLTKRGNEVLALHAENMEVYAQELAKYYEELNRVNDELKKDPYNENLLEYQKETEQAIRDTISAREDEKYAMIDLWEEAKKAELDYLSSTIDEYKKMINLQQDAYDYQKNITDIVDGIQKTQKQLTALAGDTTEESRAQVQRLTSQLKDANTSLKEAQQQKLTNDINSMLDDLSSDMSEYTDRIIREMRDGIIGIDEITSAVNNGWSQTSQDINNFASELGYNLSVINESIRLNGATPKDAGDNAVNDKQNSENYLNNNGNTVSTNSNLDVKAKENEIINGGNEANQKYQASQTVQNKTTASTPTTNNTPTNNQSLSSAQTAYQIAIDNLRKKVDKIYASASWKYYSDAAKNKIRNGEKILKPELYKGKGKAYEQIIAYNKLVDDVIKKGNAYKSLGGKAYTLAQIMKGQAFKTKEFAKGSKNIIEDMLAWTQENGEEMIFRKSDGAMLTPLHSGDMVFTKEQSQRLWDLSKMNPGSLVPDYLGVGNNTPIQNLNTTSNVAINIDSLELPNVNNGEAFLQNLKDTVQNNSQVQKMFQDLTIGSISKGYNSLGIRKY